MRAAIATGLIAVLAMGGGVHCYDPTFTPGKTKCSKGGACPEGLMCLGGVCDVPNAPTGGGGAGSGGTGAAGTTGYAGRGGGGGTAGTGGSAGGTAGTTTGGASGSAGRGGAGASAGATGGTAGGTAGTTGGSAGGTSGAGGQAGPRTCREGKTNPPPSALITELTDAAADPMSSGDFRFGSAGGLTGGTTRFASATKGTLAASGGALTFNGSVEAPSTANMYPFNGFALYLDGPACVDARAYTGVSFTITALTGTCTVVFGIQDQAHSAQTGDPDRGTCTGTCYVPQQPISASTTQVSFAATPSIPGSPTTPTDPAKLTGFQWVLKPADGATGACTSSITIDNLRFYTGPPTMPCSVTNRIGSDVPSKEAFCQHFLAYCQHVPGFTPPFSTQSDCELAYAGYTESQKHCRSYHLCAGVEGLEVGGTPFPSVECPRAGGESSSVCP